MEPKNALGDHTAEPTDTTSKSLTIIQLRVKRVTADAALPLYAHAGDAGLDLHASVDLAIAAGGTASVSTGIAVELPAGTEGQIRPRSGLALKHAVTVLNAPGTIDEGYRGEIAVLLINHGRQAFHVTRGMRIAQLVVQRRCDVTVVEVDALSDTDRGSGGFGSTGR
jgi:dUTP pyrophosphatase